MAIRMKLIGFGAALMVAVASSNFAALAQESGFDRGAGMMRHESGTMEQMRTIHDLLANHDRIRRTVTNLPDGIRTVTESDDPRIARLLKEHVAGMGQRVAAGSDPGLPMESPALRAIFRNYGSIRTTTEQTATGVIVVQTSSDPKTVTLLQQHAAEVTGLVNGGMAALHARMMQDGRGMMHGGMMHEPMMGR
jgi:hypothetical protein